jgi:hypothetical protein
MVQLINSILVLVIVGWFIKQKIGHLSVFAKSGLIDDVFMVSVTTSFLPFLLAYFVDPEQVLRYVNRWRRGGEIEAGECVQTQAELNLELENSHFYVALEYVNVNVIVLLNAFFAALQPIALGFGALGLGLLYLVKKYLLLSRYTRPPLMGKSLHQAMAGVMDAAPFFFSFGSLMVMNLFVQEGAVLVPNLVAVALAGLFVLLPVERTLRCCVADDYYNGFTQDYQESRLKLVEEYDRANPASRNEATREWAEFLKAQSRSEEETQFANHLLSDFGTGKNLANNLLKNAGYEDLVIGDVNLGEGILQLKGDKYLENPPPPGMNPGRMTAFRRHSQAGYAYNRSPGQSNYMMYMNPYAFK